MFLAKVYITLKPTVNDPQGLTIRGALHNLGFTTVQEVRAGKFLEIKIAGEDQEKARVDVENMCKKLLANTVIENFRFDLESIKQG
jgi:phosphoribosylformylglycinamidine synthase